MTMQRKRFEVRSARNAEFFRSDLPWAAISISHRDNFPELDERNRVGLLRLVFEDTSEPSRPDSFSAALAKELLDFVAAMWGKAEVFLIHCEVGLSRSPAVAAALSRIYYQDDGGWFDHDTPNQLVYDVMTETAAVEKQIDESKAPWAEACTALRKYPHVVDILGQLYTLALPFLIKGHDISPVHHSAHVVSFMAQITAAECETSPDDVKRGVVSALLHDVGIGDSTLPKITEEMVKKAPADKKAELRKSGIQSRLEHMQKGKEICERLLPEYSSLTDADIQVILDIVATHDYAKIPLMEERVQKKWLLDDTKQNAWLKQCHWEADALWMLCPAGIRADLDREKETDDPANRLAKFSFNLSLHGDVVDLYEDAYTREELSRLAFKHGLLYRTEKGMSIVDKLRTELLNEYVPKVIAEHCPAVDRQSLPEAQWDEALMRMLGLRDPVAVQSAAHALGLRGNRDALMPLGSLREHANNNVRDAADVASKNLDRWTRGLDQ